MNPKSLVVAENHLCRVLRTSIRVSPAFDSRDPQNQWPSGIAFTAIWDTGATASVITAGVARQCGLAPIGMERVGHVQGESLTSAYLAGIFLPSGVIFPSLRVTEGILGDVDALIGMDIIGKGDFAISNKDGKTVFTFRIPSMEVFDFTKGTPFRAPVAPGRNSPCPCGSGKKYKQCCGAR